MSVLASHALFFGVLLTVGWAVYVGCLLAERATAVRCTRDCCMTQTPRQPGSPRGLSSTTHERAEL